MTTVLDTATAIDIQRDRDERHATKRYEQWKGSEDYENAVQLKYEALLADPEILNEAIGCDGIQHPPEFDRGIMWADRRKQQLAYENAIYYPNIGALVMHKDWAEIGEIIGNQIHKYIRKKAVQHVKENYR
jgi:hypothetical protein